jgi:ankyrin repeat protein
VVRLFLERWPEGVIERGNCLNTPLHSAAMAGKTDVVKLFVEGWPEVVREKD